MSDENNLIVKPDELFERDWDYVGLAIRDYLRRNPEGAPQPCCDPEIVEENDEQYVVLENVNGVLAVYHFDTETETFSLTDYIPEAYREDDD